MCFSMYLCNHLINATYVMISFQPAAKKYDVYFVCQSIDGITFSPQQRKVLNELKFALLRENLPQKIRIIQNSI